MRTAKPPRWFYFIGVGDIAINLAFSMGALFLLNCHTDVVGIPVSAAGTILATIRIYEAIIGIVARRIIQRTSTRSGRFRPFQRCGSLPLMLPGIAVFSVPTGMQTKS